MKKTLFTLMVMTVSTIVYAQGRYNYDFRDNSRYNYRYDDRNDRRINTYNDRNYGYLPRKVRRRVRNLERQWQECRYKALRDGHISRRESRRLRNIEREIDELLLEFTPRYNYNRRGRNNGYCR